jgi:hypothetical protein
MSYSPGYSQFGKVYWWLNERLFLAHTGAAEFAVGQPDDAPSVTTHLAASEVFTIAQQPNKALEATTPRF